MIPKPTIAARLAVRRGLSGDEAAVYIGVSPSKFKELVGRGLMPQPRIVDTRNVYDIIELDLAFNELPRKGKDFSETTYDSWSDYK